MHTKNFAGHKFLKMRVKLTFENKKDENIYLPIHYNYLIQSFIYKNIGKELADFLHNKGFEYGKRKFKMFVFSRIFSKKFKTIGDKIEFDREISFYLSTPLNDFLSQFAENILKKPEFRISQNDLILKEVYVLPYREFKEKIKIKMLSPMTVYSTLLKGKKKKTYYYSPFEKEFEVLLRENLRKKYESFYKNKKDFDFKIEPLKVNKSHEKIIIYKKTIIKGWIGTYEIESEPEIIKFAYDTGLGAKNSQGFGMFEVCI